MDDFDSILMMKRKGGIAVVIVAILALTAAMPMASASNITAVVSPSTDSANVTAYINTTATIRSNSQLLVDITTLFANITDGSVTKVLKSNSTIYTDLQSSIQNKSSSAKLSYLSIEAVRTSDKVSSDELIVNHSVKIVMNVTNIFSSGTLNLAWRGFYDNQSVVIEKVNYNQFQIDGVNGTTHSSLDFHAFSEPLTNWTRDYNEITNRTTFTMNAGYTLNYSFNASYSSLDLNITVVSDPSFTIVTPGYAVAGANSLTYSNPPGAGWTNYIYYGVLGLIIIVGIVVAVSARRRRA